ncbi:ABC transporter permease [Frankia sp. QA3]|uniref:ABC transporter permease n=1 Tax=Frankia sp. QA3 TaxID=710111 RepID=UPI000269CE18|nr:ABC transporter permease [Frankia sp. QA3]EIV96617.1 ABC-type dipeptide/oligopeptide/nickel transport system, permease component [Frankia sp. QA3]
MIRYLLLRVGQAVFVVWAAFTLSFVVFYVLPSDPVDVMAGPMSNLSPEELDAVRAEYGLDGPIIGQYLTRLGRALHGDFGHSMQSGQDVLRLIAHALGQTLQITSLGLVLGVLGGGALALAATYVRRPWLRQTLLAIPPLGVAVPSFWVGLLLLQVLAFRWHVFPALGNHGWRSAVLPAVTLALPVVAVTAQLLARSLETELRAYYVQTGRAKGASRQRTHLRHVLRNAALPALTMVGLLVGGLMSGAVVVETVFSRPGLGRIATLAVSKQDLPVVQGLVGLSALVFVTTNLLVDLAYPLLDPRLARKAPQRPGSRRLVADAEALRDTWLS